MIVTSGPRRVTVYSIVLLVLTGCILIEVYRTLVLKPWMYTAVVPVVIIMVDVCVQTFQDTACVNRQRRVSAAYARARQGRVLRTGSL